MRILIAILVGCALAGGTSVAVVNAASSTPAQPINQLYNYGSR